MNTLPDADTENVTTLPLTETLHRIDLVALAVLKAADEWELKLSVMQAHGNRPGATVAMKELKAAEKRLQEAVRAARGEHSRRHGR